MRILRRFATDNGVSKKKETMDLATNDYLLIGYDEYDVYGE